MTWAMEQRAVTDASARHVLLCLANYAGEDGRGAFPSVRTLSDLTGLSERTVQYKLAALEEARVIRRGNQAIAAAYIGRHDRRPVVYDLDLTVGRGATAAPRRERGANDDTNGVQMTTERGARVAPDPSFNHPSNPAVSGAGAREAAKVTPAGHAAIALRRAGFAITPQDPRLLDAIAAGVTPDHLTSVAGLPECKGKPAGYVVAIAKRQVTEPPAPEGEPRNAAPRKLSAIERIEANVRRGQQHDANGFIDAEAVRRVS